MQLSTDQTAALLNLFDAHDLADFTASNVHPDTLTQLIDAGAVSELRERQATPPLYHITLTGISEAVRL